MILQKKHIFLSLLVVSMVLLAGCGGDSVIEPVEFTVEMSEFAFSPDVIEVQVGQVVTINVVNNGALEHELMFGQKMMVMNDVPSMYTVDFFDAAGVDAPEIMGAMEDAGHDDGEDSGHDDGEDAGHDDGEESGHDDDSGHDDGEDAHDSDEHGFMVSLPKNESSSFTFTVTEAMVGEWEIGCFLDSGSHYTAGMTGTLIVTP